METAMQELIEAVNKHYSNSLRTDIFDTNPFLEKEKEQIREAYLIGHYDSSLDIYNPSECYYELFNQNK